MPTVQQLSQKIESNSKAFGMLALFFALTLGKAVDLWVLFAIIAVGFVVILNRYFINKRENKSNVKIHIGLLFISLSILMMLIV